MGAGNWDEWVAGQLAAVGAAGRWRSVGRSVPPALHGPSPEPKAGGAEPQVSFSSNDYLGLSRHPAVVAAAAAALDEWGTGTGASRLVGGERPVHVALEAAVAEWKSTEAALLFPTGYAANLGVLSTFGGPDVRVVSDAANHASIVDGCRLARAEVAVYDHGDAEEAEALLTAPGPPRRLLVTDTVFSMDGDLAPVEALASACARAGALLVLDEAHAVLGPAPDLSGVTSLRVATLSKFLGSLGGVVAGRRDLVDLLVNRARPFVFTTATPPADAAAALAALELLRSAEGHRRRTALRANVDRLTPAHPSPIVPVVVGDERAAVEAARRLAEQGLLVPAIRPPTVPPGTSRLRVSVSTAHTPGQLDRLARALADLGLRARP